MKSNGLKGTRGSDCYQLFAIENGCFCVVTMPKKSNALIALKLFDNGISMPEPEVVDVAREETSRAVKSFCI